MVGAAGMTDTLVSFAAVQAPAFSDTNLVGRVLGDSDGERRVEDLLQRQKVAVRGLLSANRHLVEALRDALIERHELVGHEITDVLEQAMASRPLNRIDLGDRDESCRATRTKAAAVAPPPSTCGPPGPPSPRTEHPGLEVRPCPAPSTVPGVVHALLVVAAALAGATAVSWAPSCMRSRSAGSRSGSSSALP